MLYFVLIAEENCKIYYIFSIVKIQYVLSVLLKQEKNTKNILIKLSMIWILIFYPKIGQLIRS